MIQSESLAPLAGELILLNGAEWWVNCVTHIFTEDGNDTIHHRQLHVRPYPK